MTTVIIPTLNEATTIGPLIKAIFSNLESDTHVIVVDDESQDETQQRVRDLRGEFSNLQLIVRRGRKGLGSAVRLAAQHSKDGPIAVMDADLSHNPSFLPAMLNRLSEGYDVVVGSRYVPGGKTVRWPGRRLVISKFANRLARVALGIKIVDPMSGYIVFKSAKIIIDGCNNANFKFLLEILSNNRTLRVSEVPITFSERVRGKSKMNARVILLYLGLIVRL
ncbi:MAG: polyprenol monophosphomannose synthase, partial [Candidatus Thorarchaeota archaeon]